jgi:E2/UBC family protein B
MRTWWNKWPERLEHETRALDLSGFKWVRDEEAFRLGVLKLYVRISAEQGELELVVLYPDAYPYFRCEILAPSLDLAHHQNPFEKNLCLLGRRTHYWDTFTTAADLIRERLPVVLLTGTSKEKGEVEGLEQRQAEPISEYYNCVAESMIIVQSGWSIPVDNEYGYLLLGTQTPMDRRVQACLRAAVLEIRDADNNLLTRADDGIRSIFSGNTIEGCWVRLAEPFRDADQMRIVRHVLNLCPFAARAKANHVEHNGKSAWLQVWGIVFPEENAWREIGDGWSFTYLLHKNRASAIPSNITKGKRVKRGSRK